MKLSTTDAKILIAAVFYGCKLHTWWHAGSKRAWGSRDTGAEIEAPDGRTKQIPKAPLLRMSEAGLLDEVKKVATGYSFVSEFVTTDAGRARFSAAAMSLDQIMYRPTVDHDKKAAAKHRALIRSALVLVADDDSRLIDVHGYGKRWRAFRSNERYTGRYSGFPGVDQNAIDAAAEFLDFTSDESGSPALVINDAGREWLAANTRPRRTPCASI
jgi:hypothetical protein